MGRTRRDSSFGRWALVAAVGSVIAFSQIANAKKPKKVPPPAASASASATDSAAAAAPTTSAAPAASASASAVPNVVIGGDLTPPPTPPSSMSPDDKEPVPCQGDNCPGDTWDLSSVFGVRIALLHNSGPSSKTTFGVTAQGAGETYRTYKILSVRTSGIAGLGGGSGGLEGALGGTLAIGVRIPVSPHHGPVIRVGLGGELLGNSVRLLTLKR